MAKSAHGGKREGAGRKKGEELKKVTIWVDKEAFEKAKEIYKTKLNLSAKVSDLLKDLIKGNEPD